MTDAPEPMIENRPRKRFSWVWLVPLIAAIAGAVLLVRSYNAKGPELKIMFSTATGLEAGKTEVKFKDVTVGKVTDVQLASDSNSVMVSVELRKSAARLAVADSRFWVVRPRFDTSGVSGLGTLLSGAHIGVDAGDSNKEKRRFTGLEAPPPVAKGEPGSRFTLISNELGSLDAGSPVYYRHLEAGQIEKYQLDELGQQVTLQVFIKPPFNQFVNRQTRFWNASGINVSLAGGSFSVQTQSLTTMVLGGIAFGNPPEDDSRVAVEPNQTFSLYSTRSNAMEAAPAGDRLDVEFLFEQSVAGLARGADVQFMGVSIGRVTGVEVDYLEDNERFFGVVNADLVPQKLGPAYRNLLNATPEKNRSTQGMLTMLIENGLRAQLKSANLLTGQQQIVFTMRPDDPAPAEIMTSSDRLRVPTVPGTLDALQVQVASLMSKLQKVPFGELGDEIKGILQQARETISRLEQTIDGSIIDVSENATATIKTAGDTFATLNRDLLPSANQAVQQLGNATERVGTVLNNTFGDEDAILLTELRQALRETERALRAVRDLATSVKRDPQQMLLGRQQPVEPLSGRRSAPNNNKDQYIEYRN